MQAREKSFAESGEEHNCRKPTKERHAFEERALLS
jgi:hypothetical protein